MPIYEYQCDECGERFEQFVRSLNAPAAPACPKCGSAHVSKAISLFGVAGASSGGGQAASASCGPTAST